MKNDSCYHSYRHQYYYHKIFLTLAVAAGVLFAPAVFVFAQTTAEPSDANIAAAMNELGMIAGQPITTVAQARELCNLERYLADCAAVGKKHNLYKAEEIEQVDAVLSELKGKIVEDLKQCVDETCLLDVANKLALQIAAKNPTVARQMDLTTTKVAEKRVIVVAAKEAGVNFRDCQVMDPDTASVELLRSCAKLAKDTRIQKYIPEEAKQLVSQADSSAKLRDALAAGRYQCGNNTLEGCGNFCLSPSAEALETGAAAIPPVCRMIATEFFGPDGVKDLESAYSKVQQATDYYIKKAEAVTFTTHDGRVLLNARDVGRYLEVEGKKGNVEAAERGMDFLVGQGFIKPADKEFALKMVRTVREKGGIPDFDQCARNPASCREFIPEDHREEFDAMEKVYALMTAEMNKEGVPSPEVCEDPRYGEGCLRAAKRALPQIEALAGNVPEARFIIEEIKMHISFGEEGQKARDRARQEFRTGEGTLTIGTRQLRSFEEMDVYCREHGNECLAEAARKGFIDKEYATRKFEQVYEEQFGYDRGFEGPYPGFDPSRGVATPPGQTPGFTAPGPGFNPPPGFNREAARRAFERWLENPQGPPPVPYYPYQPPYVPREGDPRDYIGDYSGPYACPQVYAAPCQIGYYREVRNVNGCSSYGQCVPAPGYIRPQTTSTNPQVCPSLPSVDTCPSGQRKQIAWSSPECGTYYACVPDDAGLPLPTTCSSDLIALLGQGCHQMSSDSSGNPIYCNSEMTRSAKRGDTATTAGCPGGGPSYPGTPPSGQREQIWNSQGLRSWIRTDASQTRIDSLKTACASVGSNANVWTSNAGTSSSEDFGMPDPAKCSRAAQCTSTQYFDGAACVAGGTYPPYPTNPGGRDYRGGLYFGNVWMGCMERLGSGVDARRLQEWLSQGQVPPPWGNLTSKGQQDTATCEREAGWFGDAGTGGSTCPAELTVLLGSGCHPMYSDSSGNQIYCDGPMSKSAKRGDTATTAGCQGSSYPGTGTPPSGQREQIWNSQGLRSWIRTDASQTRIDSLKQACTNIPSGANVWMPGAGDYASPDFGMPSADKCSRAAACTANQYFDGASCVSSSYATTSPPYSGGQICDSALTNLLGSGCHYMYNDSSGNPTFCDSAMTRSAKRGDTTTTSGCSSGASTGTPYGQCDWATQYFKSATSSCAPRSNCTDSTHPDYNTSECQGVRTSGSGTTCPSGQWWDGAAGRCTSSTGTTTTSTTTTNCLSGQWWDSATQSCRSSTTTSSCPSFAHEMSGYCMLNNDTSRCSEYSNASSESNYTNAVCGAHGTGGTTTGTGSGSCPSGQYWYVPSSGGAGYCRTTSSTDCPSGQWWDSATNSCRSSTTTTSSCPSGYHSMGSYCMSDSSPNDCQPTGGGAVYACSGSTGGTGGTTSTSCPSGQYWNGTSCVSSTTTTSCPSGQYWNGTSCVATTTSTTTSTSCPSGQYWSGSACVTSTTQTTTTQDPAAACTASGGTWNGSTCQFPSTGGGGASINLTHRYAEVLTTLGRINKLLDLFLE